MYACGTYTLNISGGKYWQTSLILYVLHVHYVQIIQLLEPVVLVKVQVHLGSAGVSSKNIWGTISESLCVMHLERSFNLGQNTFGHPAFPVNVSYKIIVQSVQCQSLKHKRFV